MDSIYKKVNFSISTLDEISVKGAIFDIDGTLLDSMGIWEHLSSDYLKSKGIEPSEDVDAILYNMTFEEGCVYLKEHYESDKSEKEIAAGISSVLEDFYLYKVKAKPMAVKLVKSLYERKIPMVLATTGDERLAQKALERLGLFRYFKALLSCGALNTSKREAKIYVAALKQIGYDISEKDVYVFEDSLTAVRTAREAGFTVVGIYDEASENEQEEIIRTAQYYCVL